MATRPPELSMDAKWEAAIDLTLRRLVYGSLAGGAAGLLLFRACTPRAYFDTLLSSLARPPSLLSPCTSRLHLTNLVDCSSLNVGGAGSRSASLAFGAGAALGSAYTGESVHTHLHLKNNLLHVPLHSLPKRVRPRPLTVFTPCCSRCRLREAVREPRPAQASPAGRLM